ncbi:MAG: hydroxyacylglutathione hydrolase [Myxococcales bacterium]|nr:hydroxyacylglutathione hydrolase [Myxococcales bacterium]
MDVEILACLEDNYAYLVRDEAGCAAVVDPGEAGPVLSALARRGLRLTHVFATHHHGDHVGGLPALRAHFPALRVIAHPRDAAHIGGPVEALAGDGRFEALGLRWRGLHVPGHTLGAVAFWGGDALFSGDTLFRAGCGRLFEGDAAMMHHALNATLGEVDDATRLYPGHEYTVKNLRFAQGLLPDDVDVREALREAESWVAEGRPTVGRPMALERLTNPFLRSHDARLCGLTETEPGVACFAALRARRDVF